MLHENFIEKTRYCDIRILLLSTIAHIHASVFSRRTPSELLFSTWNFDVLRRMSLTGVDADEWSAVDSARADDGVFRYLRHAATKEHTLSFWPSVHISNAIFLACAPDDTEGRVRAAVARSVKAVGSWVCGTDAGFARTSTHLWIPSADNILDGEWVRDSEVPPEVWVRFDAALEVA